MPRVSQEHLDARRRQIIDAARRCFVRNGFHATSMQDVLAEAALSAGAVYRYFPSKDDIIAAIADDALAEISQAVQRVLDTDPAPPLPEVVGRIVATMERLDVTQNITNVPGFAVQRALLGDVDAREFADALRALLNGGSSSPEHAEDKDTLLTPAGSRLRPRGGGEG